MKAFWTESVGWRHRDTIPDRGRWREADFG